MEKTTLKDVLKRHGRSQSWLRKQLEEKGVTRSPGKISLYCNGHAKPRDNYILDLIAEILETSKEKVYKCFK